MRGGLSPRTLLFGCTSLGVLQFGGSFGTGQNGSVRLARPLPQTPSPQRRGGFTRLVTHEPTARGRGRTPCQRSFAPKRKRTPPVSVRPKMLAGSASSPQHGFVTSVTGEAPSPRVERGFGGEAGSGRPGRWSPTEAAKNLGRTPPVSVGCEDHALRVQ